MKVKLKLFFKWGIEFEEKYEVKQNGNRKVHYANSIGLFNSVIKEYYPQYFEQPDVDYKFDKTSGKKKHKNENLRISSNVERTECEDIVDTEEPLNIILEQNAYKHFEKFATDITQFKVCNENEPGTIPNSFSRKLIFFA